MLAVLLAGCGESSPRYIEIDAAYEDQFAHPVSHVLVRVDQKRSPAQARKVAYDIYAEFAEGRAFADLARTYSDHHESRETGGFIGFVPTKANTRFSGAVQALQVGQTSRPVETKLGYQIIHRHSFEEGRALEARYYYAVYGFVVPWGEGPGKGRTQDEVRRDCEAALARLRKGTSTLPAERAKLMTVDKRDDADALMFPPAMLKSSREGVIQHVVDLEPGDYTDVIELKDAFAILQRRPLIRAVIKSILISDIHAPERPPHVKRMPPQALAKAKAALELLVRDPDAWSAAVKKFTDDDTSERPDGVIGIITNGDIGWPLEQAVLDTNPGTVHPKLLRSTRGFEIIYRIK